MLIIRMTTKITVFKNIHVYLHILYGLWYQVSIHIHILVVDIYDVSDKALLVFYQYRFAKSALNLGHI